MISNQLLSQQVSSRIIGRRLLRQGRALGADPYLLRILEAVIPTRENLRSLRKLHHSAARRAEKEARPLPKNQAPRCGARCRDGHACQAPGFKRPDGSRAARCKWHGGASGPGAISEAGRAAIAASNRRRAQAKREAAST
jgi:hypothetical protein